MPAKSHPVAITDRASFFKTDRRANVAAASRGPRRKAHLNYYERAFSAQTASNVAAIDAADRVAEAYLAGKPRGVAAPDRDAAFWSSRFLRQLPADALRKESLVLGLAQYLAQDAVAAPDMLERFATSAPAATRRAARLSDLASRPQSPRRTEFARVARARPEEFGDLLAAMDVMSLAHRALATDAAERRRRLSGLSLPDFLVFAGLEGCRRLANDRQDDLETREVWTAVGNLIAWKLATADGRSLDPTAAQIRLSASIDPSRLVDAGSAHARLLKATGDLVETQIGLDNISGAWADAFSYNEPDISVVRDGGHTLVDIGASDREAEAWRRTSDRASALRVYWLSRATVEFAARGPRQSRAASRRHNWFAYLKATAAHLRLTDVYGVAETTRDASGRPLALFKALLALEIVMTSFEDGLVSPYRSRLETSNWLGALPSSPAAGARIAGFSEALPVAWTERAAVVRRIARWTADSGRGLDLREAETIVDFWSLDCAELCRRIRRSDPAPVPSLVERPFLRIGDRLAALPWMAGGHYDAAEAALGNLRRLGWRRPEARNETRRIEVLLASLLRKRGFKVAVNWMPTVAGPVVGEVDLVCARDGGVLVLEVKSTWMRRTIGDAWLHARSARQAALQLRRNTVAVSAALGTDAEFAAALGIGSASAPVRGWIVDTSLHHDHERFGGFLKVALEELVIALRDDSRLLRAVDSAFLLERARQMRSSSDADAAAVRPGLYPSGFSLPAFVEVVETGRIWDGARSSEASDETPKPVG